MERKYLGSAGYGTEEYGASGVKASRFTAVASPAVATNMVLWWLAGARAVITVAVLLAAGIVIVAPACCSSPGRGATAAASAERTRPATA